MDNVEMQWILMIIINHHEICYVKYGKNAMDKDGLYVNLATIAIDDQTYIDASTNIAYN